MLVTKIVPMYMSIFIRFAINFYVLSKKDFQKFSINIQLQKRQLKNVLVCNHYAL